jgi:DNA repair protein RadC
VITSVAAEAPALRVRVSDLPAEERPRERMLRLGPQALSNAELLAILLRTGVRGRNAIQIATEMLIAQQGLRGLAALDFSALLEQTGLGKAKATTIAAAFELGRRITVEPDGDTRPTVTTPADIARHLQGEMEALQQEELRLLIMDTKHHLLAAPTLYRGSVNAAPARIAEVFRDAVRLNAAAIAVAHNHPSGDPSPSADDIRFTEAIVDAGALIEVEVLDHIVFGRGRYVSMREKRLGFD